MHILLAVFEKYGVSAMYLYL